MPKYYTPVLNLKRSEMTNQDKITHIWHSVTSNVSARVFFKDIHRSPVFGRFVELEDYQVMKEKGFIRFVLESCIDDFEMNTHFLKAGFTKLYSLDSIEYIKLYP